MIIKNIKNNGNKLVQDMHQRKIKMKSYKNKTRKCLKNLVLTFMLGNWIFRFKKMKLKKLKEWKMINYGKIREMKNNNKNKQYKKKIKIF